MKTISIPGFSSSKWCSPGLGWILIFLMQVFSGIFYYNEYFDNVEHLEIIGWLLLNDQGSGNVRFFPHSTHVVWQ